MTSIKSLPILSKFIAYKDKFSSKKILLVGFYKTLVISSLLCIIFFLFFFKDPITCTTTTTTTNHLGFGNITLSINSNITTPTTINHIVFGLQGSIATCRFRKHYIEAWWRPNITRGYVYLEKPPTRKLLPWSPNLPPYRVNDDLSRLNHKLKPKKPIDMRMVHGILELFREEHEGMRWLIMGDDDSIFFFDNIVDVLSKYDHTKYYYIGHNSEFVMSNHLFSFRQSFGGGGIILSYPLAKALVNYMDICLRNYYMLPADKMTMTCLEDLGASLTPHMGIHQVDLRGDLSGFLSSHPKELVLSLHHMDTVDPYFPKMDRAQSVKHLMKAGNVDQSRLFQQTICYHKEKKWSFSISWGYSVNVYENILTRYFLQTPVETFKYWFFKRRRPPAFMFNTRWPSSNPCEAPHVFFLKTVKKNVSSNEILTVYSRSVPRGLPACALNGNHSADYISTIHVISPAMKRTEIQRRECCDVVSLEDTGKAEVKFRECVTDEIVA